MRKSFQLFFVFLFLCFMWTGNILAQDASMFGLAPTSVFNEKGYPLSQNVPDANTGFGTDALLSPVPFISVPIPAGNPITSINPNFTPGWCAGADIGANGVYYGCTYIGAGQSQLVSVNVGTGVPTVIGAITGITLYPTSLAYNAANNTWYYGDTDGATSRLYTLNITNGAATFVGQITGCAGLIGMAIDCNGAAYGVDIVTDQLYSINLSTGAGTAIGPLGFDASYAQDCDFDAATGTMYLAAYNAAVGQAEFRSVNLTTGGTTVVYNWGASSEITGFAIDNTCGPPCPIGAPSNPSPANGTTGLPLTGNTASWTNGSGTVNVELWFGAGTLTKVYDGAAITSFALPALNYGTTYYWYVVCKDATCGTTGPTWSFSTVQDPNLWTGTVDVYPQNANYWTGTCNASTKTQVSLVNAAGNDVGWMVFDVTSIVNNPTTVIQEIEFNGYLSANNWPYWSITPMGSVNPITDPASSINTQVSNNYQQGAAYSYNQEPGTLTNGWLARILESNANTDLKNVLGQGWFAIGIVDFDFSTTYFVNFDGWQETNRPYLSVTYSYVTPVELTSFTANANFGVVELQWITGTETNNQGFEVQRSTGNEFETIAFVEGHGTTTESQVYTYQDKTVGVGSYSYRLKQIDFDGSFEYSDVINADVPAPTEFALDQNYPNPFNPSTKITFRLAVDSKVSLKVFDVLGQEVATLVNTNLVAGAHSIDFDASALNSGVYLYRIETAGTDGSNFVDVKKMILTK